MTKFGMVCFAIALGLTAVTIANAQEASPAVTQSAPEKAPSWQAICGMKWRLHRQETGEAGRDAYIAFMRKPSAEGGCGAGETTRVRPVRTDRPGDDKLKQWIEEHKAQKQGALPMTWQDARGRKKAFGDDSDDSNEG